MMRMTHLAIPGSTRAALLGAALLASSVCNATDRIAGGQWEYTMTGDGSPRTVKSCVTAEDAGGLNADSKEGRIYTEKKSKGRCSIKSYEAVGDRISYTLVCGGREIESVTTFHGGDRSEGTLSTTVDGETVKTQVSARRLGACP